MDLDLRSGQIVGLMGRHGIGKSRVIRALAEGDRQHAQILGLPLSVTVLGDGGGGRQWRLVIDEIAAIVDEPEAFAQARAVLAEVGLAERELSPLGELDAGERCRLALARALAGDPEVLLADEPFRHLDPLAQRGLLSLLRTATTRRRLAVLFVTNDVHEALALTDRVVVINRGGIQREVQVRTRADAAPVAAEYVGLHALLVTELGAGARSAA